MLPYIRGMDTKQTRSEFYANIQMQLAQATPRQLESWMIPAPKRAARTVKRSARVTMKTILKFWR
jgi:hypothetical protein